MRYPKPRRFYFNKAPGQWPKLFYVDSSERTYIIGYEDIGEERLKEYCNLKTGLLNPEFSHDSKNTMPDLSVHRGGYRLVLEPLTNLNQIKFKYSLMYPDLKFMPDFKPT